MKTRSASTYLFLVLPLMAGIVYLLMSGESLPVSNIAAQMKVGVKGDGSFAEKIHHPLTTLLLQILVVVTAAKLLGGIFRRMGQTAVVGEIAAGIMLGPSLLGWFFPQVQAFIFPPETFEVLQLISQIGLILFMFTIGLEVDLGVFKQRAVAAVVISHVSIVFPYFLGVVLAWWLYSVYAPQNVSFITYALFMGIAMSITAFPVLARIIRERNLTKTTAGKLAIICAAIDDISAWCILAVVIAIANAGGLSNSLMTFVWSALYVAGMFLIVKPLIKGVSAKHFVEGKSDFTFSAVVFLTLIFSSFIAEIIGIHALFGAFLAGVIMPSATVLREVFTDKLEDVSISLLLPLFFAFTGLRTEIGLLTDSSLWALGALVIALAVAGKFAGSAIAAKLVGQSWKDSLIIGALMNSRGLMELVVLNIGYDLGILTKEIFTIMVLMALVTTFMTSPTLRLIDLIFKKKSTTAV